MSIETNSEVVFAFCRLLSFQNDAVEEGVKKVFPILAPELRAQKVMIGDLSAD